MESSNKKINQKKSRMGKPIQKVSNPQQLYSALSRGTPFRFKDYCVPNAVITSVTPYWWFKHLCNALKYYNDSVRTVEFQMSHSIDFELLSKALKDNEAIEAIVLRDITNNKKITKFWRLLASNASHLKKLDFLSLSFPKTEIQPLSEVLQVNTSLKTLKIALSDDKEETEIFCANLIKNQNLTALSLRRTLYGSTLSTIVNTLYQNERITRFSVVLQDFTAQEMEIFTDLIKNRKFSRLKILLRSRPEICSIIYPALKNQPNLTDLSVRTSFEMPLEDCSVFAEILTSSPVKKLTFKEFRCVAGGWDVIAKGIEESLTLEQLTYDRCPQNQPNLVLISALGKSKSLKTLKFIPYSEDCNEAIIEMIKNNQTITDLNMKCPITFGLVTNPEYDLSAALTRNNSLKKLSLCVDATKEALLLRLFDGLKKNRSLTYLDIQFEFCWCPFCRPVPKSIWRTTLMTDLLIHNQNIRTIVPCRTHKQDGDNNIIENILSKRRKKRNEITMELAVFMKTIVLERARLPVQLPMELWLVIFRKITEPGLNINYGDLFTKVLKQKK